LRNSGSGASSGASPKSQEVAGLAAVVEVWPQLPAVVKAGILAMVRAASEEQGR
jgi:hypothetical protein